MLIDFHEVKNYRKITDNYVSENLGTKKLSSLRRNKNINVILNTHRKVKSISNIMQVAKEKIFKTT